MDLFAAAGIDLGDGGRGGRSGRSAVGRTLRIPLLNYKVVDEQQKRFTFDLTPRQIEAAGSYAKTAGSARFAKLKETEVRNLFCQKILGDVLGYTQVDADPPYTLAFERTIRRGAVDVALGRFGLADGADEIVAPFELKGPTSALDAIMPGRGYSPVQQAWNYAIDVPGCRWVLVSNCAEIRLYGFGRGRDAYELFDLTKIDDAHERERLWFLLSAKQLLGGATEALLQQSDSAYKSITDDLYKDYSNLRERLLSYLTDAADGPKLAMAMAIETAQKLLDRILFVAFAERTDLLPDRLIERAAKARNEWRPEPYWTNFLALFHEIDVGNEGRGIWAYNGGLFAPDPVTDSIILPDTLTEQVVALAKWDYRSDVPVTVLGHIFEQSITDIERLRAISRGQEPPKVSKRKQFGVIYTPDVVTRFLVERTIGVTLTERFNALLAKHGREAPNNGDPIFRETEKKAERAFWRDYAGTLRALRIVDPACGSGAFLIAAFDVLAAEYRRVVEHLASLGDDIDFDPFDEIVTKNLYGVDLNAESVEITRLALWLKTARNKHRLQNLEAAIKVGDSLIDDAKFTEHPFDWRIAFAPIFAAGGFDVVIGNPPYVRMELIKPIKPYLEKNYVVAADRTDLYAYFFEQGVGLLREGGRLGFVTSSTFFRTGSGEKLRSFLGDNVGIEAVIDFGDRQIFEGVTTYPAIITLCKGGTKDGALAFLKIGDVLPKDLDAEFAADATTMPRARLGAGSWQFENDKLARLRDKIVKGKKTLGEVYGAPLYGIKTGFNEAFVVNQETRDRLVKRDKKSMRLLKPFLRGDNIKRWRVEPEGLFLINTPKGKVKIDEYPAIRDWLLPFKPELEKRATKQEWWELQQPQLAYQAAFSKPKVLWPQFMNKPEFAIDLDGFFPINKSYAIPHEDYALTALLNSKCLWFCFRSISVPKRGGFREATAQHIAPLPFPSVKAEKVSPLAELGERCAAKAKGRFDLCATVKRRILVDLAPPARKKLSRKLENWWALDFSPFRDEIKRVFHTDIPVKERGEWESYLANNAAEVRKFDAEIEKAEREIDAIVYRLFDLSPDEIALLESSIAT